MLLAKEFTVGALSDAQFGSLILPRTKYEETFLVGKTDKGITAVVLSGQYAFQCFQSSGNTTWRGLIAPNVHIEVDETSLSEAAGIGSIVRRDTYLTLSAKATQPFGVHVILEENLPPAHGMIAAFSKWHVVLGEKEDRRLLFTVDLS